MTIETSNKYLDIGEQYIKPPDLANVKGLTDPEAAVKLLDDYATPRERLLMFLKSVANLQKEPTHEALYIRAMIVSGFLGGLFLKGVLLSSDVHRDYQRRHNASIFQGRYVANRHFWDTLIAGVIGRGLGYGFKTAILSGSAGLIAFGSISYRNRLYAPDWLVGFTTLGAISRLSLGLRAVAVGSLFGAVAGLTGLGLAKSVELIGGSTVAQLRLRNHHEWVHVRQAELRHYQKKHEEGHMKYIADLSGYDPKQP